MPNPQFSELTDVIGQVSRPIADALESLAGEVQLLARELRRERERVRDLENLVGQVTGQPRTSQGTATALEQLLGELVQGQREHGAWLANLSQRLTSDRLSSDQLTAGDHLVHQQISSRYRSLIGQRLLDVAATSGAADPAAEARIRAALARALFEPASIAAGPVQALESLRQDGVPVSAERLQPLWDEAAEIRQDAAASGHRCRWMFDAEPGGAVNPAEQEVCEGCRAGEPIAFVLAPAYVVDDTIHVKQIVYTQAAPADPLPSGAGSTEADTASTGDAGSSQAAPQPAALLLTDAPQSADTSLGDSHDEQ